MKKKNFAQHKKLFVCCCKNENMLIIFQDQYSGNEIFDYILIKRNLKLDHSIFGNSIYRNVDNF